MDKGRRMFVPSYHIFPAPESDDVHWEYYGLNYETHLKVLDHRKRHLYYAFHDCGYVSSWDDHVKSKDVPL